MALSQRRRNAYARVGHRELDTMLFLERSHRNQTAYVRIGMDQYVVRNFIHAPLHRREVFTIKRRYRREHCVHQSIDYSVLFLRGSESNDWHIGVTSVVRFMLMLWVQPMSPV